MGDDYKDALIEKIHSWTYDVLNDDAKLSSYINGSAWNDRYSRIPSEKQIALDELFGVK
jgi:hypothetical protein